MEEGAIGKVVGCRLLEGIEASEVWGVEGVKLKSRWLNG